MQMLDKPLPDSHRDLSKLRLTESLNVLAGGAFEVIVDPVHRLISFQVDPMYAELFSDNEEFVL